VHGLLETNIRRLEKGVGQVRADSALDQDARAMLLDHYRSLLVSWTAMTGTFTLAFFGTYFAASDQIPQYLMGFPLGLLLWLASYSFTRVLWHGKVAEYVTFRTKTIDLSNWDEKTAYATLLYHKTMYEFKKMEPKKFAIFDTLGDPMIVSTATIVTTVLIGIVWAGAYLLYR
jgi:hypothetical protein